jgi:transposase
MIEEHTREVVRTLFEQGKRKKEIARFLSIDVKTVRAILSESTGADRIRSDKILVDPDLLKQLYHRCNGYAQRVHEILTEEYKIRIGYSTLTRLLQQQEIASQTPQRDERHPDIPGAEMQHDTSVYTVNFGGAARRVVGSGLYFRYCKMRYIKFFFRFDRFLMRCFFHEALGFFGYTAKICIVDNTNLVVLYGSGDNAVFDPQMLAFAKQYGFQWKAHRIGHANRKAGKERDFLTLETNFFPARSFADLQDLNRQAFQWATERFAQRPLSKSRLIPRSLFEEEKPYLLKVPGCLQPPYRQHQRIIDGYGYVAFAANYYWMPEKARGPVTVIEYERSIAVYQRNRKLIDYPLPAADVKNQQFSPPGHPAPSHQPHNRRYGCSEEQKRLRQMGELCCAYLDYLDSPACKARCKAKLIRDLYRLSTKIEPSLFVKATERALRYQVHSVASFERIASQLLQQQLPELPLAPLGEHYEDRKTYQVGRFSSEADLSAYKRLLEEDPDER